jgi:hypothetical protein
MRSACPRQFRRSSFAVAAVCVVTLAVGSSLLPAEAVSRTKKPAAKKKSAITTTTVIPIAPGRPCTTGSAVVTAGAVKYACVTWRGARQWWPFGTKQNPYPLNTTITFPLDPSGWELTVLGREDNDTARWLAVDPINKLVNSARQIASVRVVFRHIGPSSGGRTRELLLLGTSTGRPEIERWTTYAGAEDDCWVNESVENAATKECSMPFEVDAGELPALQLKVAPLLTLKPVYFATAANQVPLE